MSLDELFVQILESEQKAQARRSLLTKIKNETMQIQQMIKEFSEETESLKGHLAVKYQVLAEVELQRKWLDSKERILQQQYQELLTTRNTHENCLKSAKESEESKEFLLEIKRFCKRYDLCGNGKNLRQEEAKEKLEKLVHEEELLEKELAEYRTHEERVQCLEEDKCLLKIELEEMKQKVQDLDSQIYKEHATIAALEDEKAAVAKKQQTDPEFQRLQMELEACKTDSMEGMCEAYRLELQQLQQKQWQKKLNKSLKQTSVEKQKFNQRQTIQGRSAHVNSFHVEHHSGFTDNQPRPQDESMSDRNLGDGAEAQQNMPANSTRRNKSTKLFSSVHRYLPSRAKKVHFKK